MWPVDWKVPNKLGVKVSSRTCVEPHGKFKHYVANPRPACGMLTTSRFFARSREEVVLMVKTLAQEPSLIELQVNGAKTRDLSLDDLCLTR